MGDYYPRCKLRIILRLDEFGADSRLKARAPQKTTKNLKGITDPRSQLVPSLDPTAPPGVTRYVLGPKGQDPSKGAPQTRMRSDDGMTWDFEVVPREMSWAQNGLRTADTLRAAIRQADCPIDPRVTRAIAVECYFGAIPEDDHVAQVHGKQLPYYALPDGYTDSNGQQRTNLRFQGFVDKWELEFTEDAEPMIRIEARDNSQLFIDQECPPNLPIAADKPIDKAISDYLSNFVQFSGLSVEYLPSGDTPPTLNQVLSGTAFRPHLGPVPSKGGGASSQKLSVLDYLTDVTHAIGHTVRVDGTSVVVQKVRSLMTSSGEQRAGDPFVPRVVDGGRTIQQRQVIYGKAIRDMRVTRNFSKQVPTNVEVRCYLTERKKTLVARFPQAKDRQVYALPGNTQPDQKWAVYEVSGINNEKTLRTIAQGIYEELGRHEVQVEIKTRDLWSFAGNSLDPDFLDMKVGDTFELLVDRSQDSPSTITQVEQQLTAQARGERLLVSAGFSDEFARAYAQQYTNAGFLTQFKLKTMKVDWNLESDHVSLELMGINYIVVRADSLLPQGEETSSTARSAT